MGKQQFWFSTLTRSQKVTTAAVFGGRMLDAMDSQVYALLLPTLITVFSLSRAQAGTLGSLTTLVAAVSNIFAGIAVDRFGRLRVLQAAVAISGVATVLAAFSHSFGYLAAIRAIQGIGYAAELTAGATLINEAVQSRVRGRVYAATQTGYAVGYATALLAMLAAFAFVPETYAWRALFLVGAVPTLYVIVLQRFVGESELFLEQRRVVPVERDQSSLRDVFRGENRRNALIIALISMGMSGAAQIMIFWLPTYLRSEYHLNITKTAGYLALNILGSFIGPLVFGPLSDRFGRRRVFLAFLCLQAVVVSAYLGAVGTLGVTLVLGMGVGILQSGLTCGLMPIHAELFGTSIRGRAIGINSVFIRTATSSTPALVGVLSTRLGFGLSMWSVAIVCYAMAIIGALMVRETLGTEMVVERSADTMDTTQRTRGVLDGGVSTVR